MKTSVIKLIVALAFVFGLAAVPQIAFAASLLVGTSSLTDSVYSIDPTTGQATLLSTVNGNLSLVGASFLDGNLFVSDIFGTPGDPGGFNVGTVDLATGTFTFVNDQDGSSNWHGLASNESADLLYTIDRNDNFKLKTMTASGVVTTIGSGAGINGTGMAYDDTNGILYATAGSDLYTVDTTAGTSALVGSMGIGGGFLFGLAYDELLGVLYANDANTDSLYTLSAITGAATLVGLNNVADIDGLAWVDISEVPLPAALPLFGTGLGIMGFIGWRRKRRMAAEAA